MWTKIFHQNYRAIHGVTVLLPQTRDELNLEGHTFLRAEISSLTFAGARVTNVAVVSAENNLCMAINLA